MAKLNDEDRKELLELFGDAFAAGMGKYRSALEEEEAKRKQAEGGGNGNDNKNDSGKGGNGDSKSGGIDIAGFLLGG